MNAYKCDGCHVYRDGEPRYVIEPTHRTVPMPPRWEACSDACLVAAAKSIASRRRPAEEPR